MVTFVRERLDKGADPTEVSSELLNACLANDPREARGIGWVCAAIQLLLLLLQEHLFRVCYSGELLGHHAAEEIMLQPTLHQCCLQL